jgi:small subunit ribosomal protein S5
MAEERKRNNAPRDKEGEGSEFIDKLVSINRTTKVVKGGRRFGFAALVVVGDGKGKIGYGKGKAKEVADAKRKATEAARKSMVKIPLREGRTLHHDIKTKDGAGGVIIRTAAPGTGIIAGGPMRAIFEALGVKDVVAKSNNITIAPRTTPVGDGFINGFKVKAINGVDATKLKIQTKKFNN